MRLSLSLVPTLLLTLPALAADPKLVRVTLSTGGVGQYEFTAALAGPDHVDLPAALGEVDDLLASLRIDDPAGGGASVRLPGRQPVDEAFRSLPFTTDALASPEALLQALVGADVRLPGASLTGAILSVTAMDAKQPDGAVVTRHRLAIATATGIASAVLEDQPEVELTSAPLRAQLATALAAIAGRREQDRRILQVDLPAAGPRTVRLGYVVPAPVWKASYRLTLPETGPARLQGYAVVENLSGQDWNGVDMVLTSGQPVLFHQALYDSVFVTRPDLPVAGGIAATPQADEGTQPEPPGAAKMLRAMPAPALAPAPMAAPPVSEPQDTAVIAEQAATQVEFHIAAPVDAAAGQSLLLPILDRAVPTKRVALVSPESGLHPFVALQITNVAGSALPPGLATLYREADGARFVGNAALPAMQPGEDRLLSFAGDLSTDVTIADAGDSAVIAVHAARGTVTVSARDRNVTTYRVTTAPGEARSMLIEQPIRAGWTLTAPAGGSRTPTRWRIAQDVPAGVTQDIKLVTEHPRSQTIQVGALSPALLREYAGNAGLDPAARAAFARAGALYADADRQQEAVKALAAKIAAIVADQERIRANLASTAQNQALQKRYIALLQQQEDALSGLRGQQDAAQAEFDKQNAAFKDYLASMAF
jgi:hypothetical protein